MAETSPVQRKLAAILAADIAGYSRLMGADEEGTLRRLKALRAELLDPAITGHNGRIVKTTGDGLLVEFASVVDAMRCATQWQRAMAERTEPADSRIEWRIGVNVGDVIIDEGDIYGDGVNIAARLEAMAEPGGICISRTVLTHTRGKLDFPVEDLGDQALKNIAQRVLPIKAAPASSKVCTAQAWRVGTGWVRAQSGLPPPVGRPATSNRSLAAKVSPESGPPGFPSRRNCCPGTKAPISSGMILLPLTAPSDPASFAGPRQSPSNRLGNPRETPVGSVDIARMADRCCPIALPAGRAAHGHHRHTASPPYRRRNRRPRPARPD